MIFGDTDAMGIVYYANYLRYFEAGRAELLRALEIPYGTLVAEGIALPVVNASIRYVSPARFDDALVLDTTIEDLRHASVRITYRLTRESDAALIATGETTHACLGPDGRVARFPTRLVEKLRPA